MADQLMEMVDIVNENNEVLYQVAKSEAHEKGLLHRTVISEIKDLSGRWVLVRQAADRQDAGQYVSPVGGHVQAGETEDEALIREAKEECGISDFNYKFVGRRIFNRYVKGRQENHYFILYEINHDSDDIRLNHESDDYKIFAHSELKDLLQQNPDIFGNAFHFIVKIFYPDLLV